MSSDYEFLNLYIDISGTKYEIGKISEANGTTFRLDRELAYNINDGDELYLSASKVLFAKDEFTSISSSFFMGSRTVNETLYSGYSNFGFGKDSLNKVTTGKYNIAMGNDAGLFCDIAENNIFMGHSSGLHAKSAKENVCLGNNTLRNIDVTYRSTAIGHGALESKTDDLAATISPVTSTGSQTVNVDFSGADHQIEQNDSLYNSNGEKIVDVSSLSTSNGEVTQITGDFQITVDEDSSDLFLGDNPSTAIGYNSLKNETFGGKNTALGTQSGYYLTTGSHNVAVGYLALDGTENSCTGSYNVGVGAGALSSFSSGSENVAIGHGSGENITTGQKNVLIGNKAAHNIYNTTVSQCVAIGWKAGAGAGGENVSIGNQTLGWMGNGSTSNCVAVGNLAGFYMNGTQGSVVLGSYSGYNITTGNSNVCVGRYSGYAVNTGAENVLIGERAGYAITDGSNNICIGHRASVALTGNHNIIIGSSAASSLDSGDGNVIIGNGSALDGTTDSNVIAIGRNVSVGHSATVGSNSVTIGNSSISSAYIQTDWTISSDRRIKYDIQDSDLGLEFIKLLKPSTYKKVNPSDYPEELLETAYKEGTEPRPQDDETIYTGLIAQEVESALQTLNTTWSGHKKLSCGKQALQYSQFVVPLINAVKELSTAHDTLKAEHDTLKAEHDTLKEQYSSLEARILALENK